MQSDYSTVNATEVTYKIIFKLHARKQSTMHILNCATIHAPNSKNI